MRSLLVLLLSAAAACAQCPAGKWVSNLKYFEDDNYDRLELTVNGTKLTGKLGDDVFEGVFQDGTIEGTVKPNPRETIRLRGRIDGDRIEGTGNLVEHNLEFRWEARREPPSRSAPPQTHTFEPTEFHHFFSRSIAPALHINPGDTVKTWSVDAGGTDPKGVLRTSGGNPLTGPFYVEGAVPGDTLIVHLDRVRLNRDTAGSSPLIVNDALEPDYVESRKKIEGYNADWRLDR